MSPVRQVNELTLIETIAGFPKEEIIPAIERLPDGEHRVGLRDDYEALVLPGRWSKDGVRISNHGVAFNHDYGNTEH